MLASNQTTLNPKDENGEEIPVTVVDPKTGTVEGPDAAAIDETDEDPPSEEQIEREKEMEMESEIDEPEMEPTEEDDDEEKKKEEERKKKEEEAKAAKEKAAEEKTDSK